MSKPLLQIGGEVICSHGGHALVAPLNSRVFLSGQPAVVLGDAFVVAGCPADPSCIGGEWTTGAIRVRIIGRPVILQDSSSITQNSNGIFNGLVQVVSIQTRVVGT